MVPPPPIDRKDSGTKTRSSPSSNSSSMAARPGESDAERRQARYHREHRPMEKADRGEDDAGERDRREAGAAAPRRLDAGRDGHADRRRRDAVEHEMHGAQRVAARLHRGEGDDGDDGQPDQTRHRGYHRTTTGQEQ